MEFGSLWEVLAVLVFLLAPVWRSVMETRRRALEEQRKRAAGPQAPQGTTAEPVEPELDPWEALLRGMEPEPAPVEPERFEPEPEPEFDRDFDRQAPVVANQEEEPESLVAFPSYGGTSHTDLAAEEVGGLADELQQRDERRAALPTQHVIGGGLSSLAPSVGLPVGRSPRERLGTALKLPGDAADWRSAVVLTEVLGPPIALRPTGYREPH